MRTNACSERNRAGKPSTEMPAGVNRGTVTDQTRVWTITILPLASANQSVYQGLGNHLAFSEAAFLDWRFGLC